MRSVLRTLDGALVRQLLALGAGMLPIGASFGAIAVSTGQPWWVPTLMSTLVFAGSAQFLAVAIAGAGGGALAAVLGALILNARFLPFGMAVGHHVGPSWWQRVIGSHFIVDESVALGLSRPEPDRQRMAFFAAGATVFVSWNIGTTLGIIAGNALGDPKTWGLDAAFPAALLAFVLPRLRDRPTVRAAVCGAVIAVATTPFLPAGVPVLLGLVGMAATGRTQPKTEERTA